jgi:hypothetical protein
MDDLMIASFWVYRNQTRCYCMGQEGVNEGLWLIMMSRKKPETGFLFLVPARAIFSQMSDGIFCQKTKRTDITVWQSDRSGDTQKPLRCGWDWRHWRAATRRTINFSVL